MDPALLIVDDNPNNLRSMQALLEDTGAEMVLANSGQRALMELLHKEFALILLDVQMPEMDGYETARLIRQRDRSRHTPIIFVTAHHRTDDSVRLAYELGAVDFLFKPVVPEILRSKVSVFLELFRKSQELQRHADLLHDAQKREHERSLQEAKAAFDRQRLEQEAAKEREHKAALEKKAAELARLVEEKEAAHAHLERHANRLQLLADTADELLRASDAASAWRVLEQRVLSALQADVFLRFEVGPGSLRLEGWAGVGGADLEHLHHLPAEAPFAQWCRSALRRTAAPSTEGFPSLQSAGLHSAAIYPVIHDSSSRRVLCVASRTERTFDEADLSLLQILCDQAIVAVERARLVSELRDADRRKDEFIAMLGHELRNPLTPIQNSLEVFRARAGDDPVAQRALSAADRQVRHMTRLVDDLLDVSRITRGKVELRRQQASLFALVEQAVHSVEPTIQRKGQTFSRHLPAEDVLLDVDPNRVVQVLANLLGNAARYTPARGRIELEVAVEGPELQVWVRDSGVGIPPEMLTRIFEVFVQGAPTADRADGGLGIGLTLARRLSELHGGTLEARSDGPGKGSEFELRLPVVLAGAAQQPSRQAPAPASAGPFKVLLVEDNADIRETLADLLEMHGHHVHQAQDGAEGLEQLCHLSPDLALVDIGLPTLDGYGVAREFRSKMPGGHTQLVALTGYGTEDDRRRAREAGFDAHLTKPVTFEDLTDLFRRLSLKPRPLENAAHAADDDESQRHPGA